MVTIGILITAKQGFNLLQQHKKQAVQNSST